MPFGAESSDKRVEELDVVLVPRQAWPSHSSSGRAVESVQEEYSIPGAGVALDISHLPMTQGEWAKSSGKQNAGVRRHSMRSAVLLSTASFKEDGNCGRKGA